MAESKLKQIEREKGKPMPQILQELHGELGSQSAIAVKLNVTQGTVSLWFTRFGLKEKKTLVRESGC